MEYMALMGQSKQSKRKRAPRSIHVATFSPSRSQAARRPSAPSNDVALTHAGQSSPTVNLSCQPATPESCRHRVLQRALRIARLVEQQRSFPGLRWFAEHFEVNERTVRRDLLALESAGWPVPEKPWTSYAKTEDEIFPDGLPDDCAS